MFLLVLCSRMGVFMILIFSCLHDFKIVETFDFGLKMMSRWTKCDVTSVDNSTKGFL